MTLNLESFLSGHVFAFMLVFARLAGALMLFPGIGEAFVSARLRMLFALTFTFLVYPVVMPSLPPLPDQVPQLALLIAKESFVGVFFGTIMRLMMDILETTGSIIAMQVGLSNAMILNPTLASQSALPSAFLGIAAIALVFVTGLDTLLFRAMMDTYVVFPAAKPLPYGDMTQVFIQTLSKSFSVGVQLAMPFMVVGLLFYVALGMMQRMMPQIQLFLVIIPVQIWGGFFILSLVAASLLGVWLQVFDDTAATLFVR